MMQPAFAIAGDVDPVALSIINWVEEQIDAKRADYALYRRYYGGDHKVLVTKRMRKFLPQNLTFRDNLCDVAIDSMAERMRVTGFEVEGADDTDQRGKWLWDLWKTARMDRVQSVGHTETLMLGDGYVLVDWDNVGRRPRMFYQEPEMMIPHYDASTGELAWLSKKWRVEAEVGEESDTHRLNLYYPDRIEKYVSERTVWKQMRDETDTDWPQPWVDSAGQPLGIPVIHFRNMSLSDDYGRSELSNAVPLQDLINKSLIDYTQVADTMGWPQRYLVNITTGRSEMDMVPGALWELMAETEGSYQVGQFATADLGALLKGMEMLVDHFSAVTRTPKHFLHLSGNYPSGEALKTAEAGLVSKISERHTDFGNSWENVMKMALRLDAVFGQDAVGALGDDVVLNTIWKDPETRNEEAHYRALAIKKDNLGVSQEQIWRELGYDDTQIEAMQKDIEDEQVRASNLGSAVLERFARGQDGGGQAGGP